MKRHRSWYVAAFAAGAALVLLGAKCSLFNKAPAVPAVTGPAQGVAGVPVTFKATAADPDGDSIAFQFDWGDTTTPAWSAFLASGETLSATHTYADSGDYAVKAKAKDAGGEESEWTAGIALDVGGLVRDYPDSVFGTISVPIRSVGGAVTPDGQYLYVRHEEADFITPVRLIDRVVLPPVTVGRVPYDIAVTPDSRFLYVACDDASAIAVVRTADNVVVARVEVGRMPLAVVVTPNGEFVYVALSQEPKLMVVRTTDNAVVDSIALSAEPRRLAVHPDGTRVYARLRGGLIAVVSTSQRRVTDSTSVGLLPDLVCVSPTGDRLYVTNQTDSGYVAISTSSLLATGHVNLGDPTLTGIASTPDSKYVLAETFRGLYYVSAAGGLVLDSLAYGREGGVTLAPHGDSLYLYSNNLVYVVGRR